MFYTICIFAHWVCNKKKCIVISVEESEWFLVLSAETLNACVIVRDKSSYDRVLSRTANLVTEA